MFKVIWSVFADSYIVVPYNYGVIPKFEGSYVDCINYIKSNLS